MVSLDVVVFLFVIFVSVIGAFFAVRQKIHGKIIVFLVEKDRSLSYKIFKPVGRLFTFSKKTFKETYIINTERVMLTKFPFGGVPSFLKQIVPCLIYARNNPEPLDPTSVSVLPKGITAKELAASLDENVINDIVKATNAETKKERFPAWLIAAVCVVLCLIILIVLFWMKLQMSGIQNSIATGGV